MFTGLIRNMAFVKSFSQNILALQCLYKPSIGDSIAINGVCLTATKIINDIFYVDISNETLSISTLGQLKIDSKVHIEPAMTLNDRLDGHILQGHIDSIGLITKIQKQAKSYDMYISFSKSSKPFIIPKGSIAIDGVSLTINEVFDNSLRLTIIPHTYENSLLKTYNVGTKVNIETDFFAKYVYNMLNGGYIKKDNISWHDIDNIQSQY